MKNKDEFTLRVLARDMALYVTGEMLSVDGAMRT